LITLSELLNKPEMPEQNWGIGLSIAEKAYINRKRLKTKSLLYVLSGLKENLAPIAVERTLKRKWENHPMFGILSDECTDKYALDYQKVHELMENILDEIMKRIKD